MFCMFHGHYIFWNSSTFGFQLLCDRETEKQAVTSLHINYTSGSVSPWMGQLSLVIPAWRGAVSTRNSWGVKGRTVRCPIAPYPWSRSVSWWGVWQSFFITCTTLKAWLIEWLVVYMWQLALVVCASSVQYPHLHLWWMSSIHAASAPRRLARARDILLVLAAASTLCANVNCLSSFAMHVSAARTISGIRVYSECWVLGCSPPPGGLINLWIVHLQQFVFNLV